MLKAVLGNKLFRSNIQVFELDVFKAAPFSELLPENEASINIDG